MDLKIVYKIYCGIDTHKTFVVVCIASANFKSVTSYESHRFSTYTKGLKDLLQWLFSHNCRDVSMESTGKYWISVYNILEKNNCSFILAHHKYVKAIREKNWPALNQVKRTTCRTVSRFPISIWETLFRTSSTNLRRWCWIRFWKIPQILSLISRLLCLKVEKETPSASWYYWWLYYTGIDGQT